MAKQINWGILSTARIAGNFIKGLNDSRTGKVLAVGSRSMESAKEFAAEHGVPKTHGSYEDLLADPEVDAVYIATPHPMHAEWCIKAARAGKHILCEKPVTLNAPDAMRVIDEAERNDVFFMEAFMYRSAPQTKKIIELIRDGAIGQVRVIKATFSFQGPDDPSHRLLNNALGGGGILDVGCYCCSAARMIAGVALGTDFAEPLELTGYGHLGETGVDEWAVASAVFPRDIFAQLATGVRLRQDNLLMVFGTDGWINVPLPWIPTREPGESVIELHAGGETETIEVQSERHLYSYEADVVAERIEQREGAFPAMSRADTLGNMRMLDLWREAIGLTYEQEKPGNVPTIHRGPLSVREEAKMPTGRVPGVEKDVSRLVMGVDHPRTAAICAVLFDDYMEYGGNCFDSAWVYGGGAAESLLGAWVESRGVRDDIVLLDKGAHTPECTPEGLDRQFRESLERLRTDYVDIYMLHRDNPAVPVGEFMDVLHEHTSAGRMKAYGGSNWTIDRIEGANAYAAEKGYAPMAAVSNNFSLAEMVNPVWAGCLHMSDAASREWLERTGTVLMPWSSQARGFFVLGDPAYQDDASLARCWYSEENFRRLERAKELAGKKGVTPLNIALAYVLCQPFPTFPLIGPRTPAELRTSLPALSVELTPEELAWLDLRKE